jgi:hypothetical protein
MGCALVGGGGEMGQIKRVNIINVLCILIQNRTLKPIVTALSRGQGV